MVSGAESVPGLLLPPLHSPWTLPAPSSSWDEEETEVLSCEGDGEGGRFTPHPVGTSGLAAPEQEDRTRPLPSLGLKGIKLPFLDWRPQKPLELVQAERNLLKATKVHIDSIKGLEVGLGRNSRQGWSI